MKKSILSLVLLVLLVSCGGVKKTQKAINAGDYTNAMNDALEHLAGNKTKKAHQPYILMLEEAFKKNTDRELQQIAFLEKDGNQANYESIYQSYINLRNIQERIKPLLPLRLSEQNRAAVFAFNDYETDIINYKEELSTYLYARASHLLTNAQSKEDYRKSYADFSYLNEINPDFEDTTLKMEQAYGKGIDYVEVRILNNSNQIIPQRLATELFNFNTYGLDDLWTKYHSNPQENIAYNYAMQVSLDQIDISPEQIREKETIVEKQIKDGFQYAVDQQGNTVKDSLGNKVKVDKFKTIRCKLYQFTQFKSAHVAGNIKYIDLQTKQQINTYPMASEFIFEHAYASSDGDERALSRDLTTLLNRRAMPFPSNEQMVYDAGEDLKSRLKNIMKQQRFN